MIEPMSKMVLSNYIFRNRVQFDTVCGEHNDELEIHYLWKDLL
jgi:hypothetical protein